MNLARILGDAVTAHAERPALFGESGKFTYAEVERRSNAASALLLQRGVAAGDRVALMLPNGPAFVAAALGALRLGAILVPLNSLLAPPEVEARLKASRPRVFLENEGELEAEADPVAEPVERAAADPAVILFTSGRCARARAT